MGGREAEEGHGPGPIPALRSTETEQDRARRQTVTGVERRQEPRPRTAKSRAENGKGRDRDPTGPGRSPPPPSSPHPRRPTQKDTSTKASAASSSYGPWRRRPRPIQTGDSRALPSRAATPTLASPRRRARQTQNGRHGPSWRHRLRAPSLHRGAAGGGCPRDGLPAVPRRLLGCPVVPRGGARPPFCFSRCRGRRGGWGCG